VICVFVKMYNAEPINVHSNIIQIGGSQHSSVPREYITDLIMSTFCQILVGLVVLRCFKIISYRLSLYILLYVHLKRSVV
jgi:hypothetical protein